MTEAEAEEERMHIQSTHHTQSNLVFRKWMDGWMYDHSLTHSLI